MTKYLEDVDPLSTVTKWQAVTALCICEWYTEAVYANQGRNEATNYIMDVESNEGAMVVRYKLLELAKYFDNAWSILDQMETQEDILLSIGSFDYDWIPAICGFYGNKVFELDTVKIIRATLTLIQQNKEVK